MSGVLKVISKIAAVVALVPGPWQLPAALVAVGAGIGASALAKRPKTPQASRESIDRLNASIDPRTPRKMVFGQTAMATDIRDQEYTNNQEYLHRFIVVAAHKVQAIDEIWFDDKKAWAASGGVQGEYAGYLTVTPILEGSAGNAINISPRMGSTRRFTGLAYVHLRYKLTGNSKKTDSPFAQGIATRMTIRGKGALVYDPRKDSTVPGGSGSHRADNQSTWAWDSNASRNPALQKLWYLLGWRINGKLSVGRGIPPSRIDLESYAIAANLCDEAATLVAGGTEPRYRADGVFSEGDSPTTVIDNFKAAMNADLDDVGGRLRLTVFHNDLADPIAAFGDDDMIEPFKWSQTPSLVDSFNLVRGSYTDASDKSLYQMVDYPQVELASPDGIERPDSFDLALVQSPSQAQRLAKQRLQRQQYGGEFRTVWGARGWLVQKNSVVTQSCTVLGWTNKLFRVADMEHRVDGTCPVVLREENAEIYAWDKDEGPAVDPADPTVYDFTKSAIYLGLEGTGKLFVQTAAPNAADSTGGDIWQSDDGRYWIRRGDNHLSIGGKRLMIGGKLLTITWTPTTSQPVADNLTMLRAAADAAAQLALDAQATADGKVQSYYATSAPTAEGIGDLWFDTDDGNKQYRWSGSAWVAVQDTKIGDALTAAAGAQATADGKVTTFVGEGAPTAEGIGDLWFRPSTGYLARWSGSAWVDISNIGATPAQITSIGAALTSASNAQATADGKVDTFYQTSPPAGTIGDLWFDTDDGNKLYRHNGTTWVAAQDGGIGAAITAAAGAQATADGKVTTFVGESAPSAVALGDLWFKVSNGQLRRWSGSAWGNPLVDLTANSQVTVVPPPAFTLYRTWDGQVKAGQLPATLRPSVKRGGTDITQDNDTDYSVTGTSGLASKVTVNTTDGSGTKADITIANTVTAGGTIQLTVTVGGIAIGTYTVQVVTKDDNPPVDNGVNGGTDASLAAISSTSYAVMTGLDGGDPVMDVAITSGQTLKLTALISYVTTSTSPLRMTCKGQYSTDGVTWNDMDTATTEVSGSAAQRFTGPPSVEQGDLSATFTKTGLATGPYKVRLMGKLFSGSGTLTPTDGRATSSKS